GEDLVVAVPVDVGHPQGVAIGEGIVDDVPRSEAEGPLIARRSLCEADHDLAPVPWLDRREELSAIGEASEMNLARSALRRLARRADAHRPMLERPSME